MKNNLPYKTTKANSLHIMKNILGLNVPDFIVVDKNVKLHELEAISQNLNWKVSVRSSGSVSTPGRMLTFLDVDNNPAILRHYIDLVVDSGKSDRVKEYLQLKDIHDFETEVIIQNYINTKYSGISGVIYTNEIEQKITFEYVYSSGDKLMDGNVTPFKTEIVSNPIFEDIWPKIMLLKDYFEGDVEVEVCRIDNVFYFLQCRPLRAAIIGECINNMSTDLYCKYTINLEDKATGYITTDINANNPNECFYLTSDTLFSDLDKLVRFKGIITTRGGLMCHAAILAREFPQLIVGLRINDISNIDFAKQYTIQNNGHIIKLD